MEPREAWNYTKNVKKKNHSNISWHLLRDVWLYDYSESGTSKFEDTHAGEYQKSDPEIKQERQRGHPQQSLWGFDYSYLNHMRNIPQKCLLFFVPRNLRRDSRVENLLTKISLVKQ